MERAVSSRTFEPVNLDRSVIVRAGAGAGKTTALTEQVLGVAKEYHRAHARYPRIIVTTFTKKATQELKERLVLLALKTDQQLLEFVNSSSVLKISTIHGILDQYLRQYGSFIQLDPSFTIIDSSFASQLARQVIRQILLTHDEKELLQELIDDFSFKRLEKLCRSYYQVKLQYPEMTPHSEATLKLLSQTYICSLGAEIVELVQAIRNEETNPKWLAYAAQMEKFSQELCSHDWELAFDFLKNFYESIAGVSKTKNIKISEDTNLFKKSIEKKIDKLFEDDSFQPFSNKQFAEKFLLCEKLFAAFTQEFLRTKIKSAFIEINDLELLALKLSREFSETAQAFSQEWDYWLIDEYQDTSPVQVELIEKLSQAKPQYVVGDPQQSIYLFRGARSEVFQSRERDILENNGIKEEKITNYRSRPELLEFFNDFFSTLQIPFSPMIASMSSKAATERSDLGVVASFYLAEKKSAGEEACGLQDDDELLAIVEHIEKLLAQGQKLEDICVLGRTHQILSDVSKALTQFGLANHIHISSGFYERREIQDALALYKFLIHPHNNLNLMVLLRSPWFSVDEQFLIDHIPLAKDSYWIYFSQFKEDFANLKKLASYLDDVGENGLGRSFLNALIDSGIFDFAAHLDKSGRIESNLWKIVSLLRDQENRAGFNPLDLLSQIESAHAAHQGAEGDAVPAVEPERINLMTIHASKGLQFRHVIVARMHKKPKASYGPDFLFDEREMKWSLKIPFGPEEKFMGSLAEKDYIEKLQKSEIAEHARVLYVALTRAIDSVFLTWTRPVEKNSWAEMINWDLSSGLHQTDKYSYEVLSHRPTPQKWQAVRSQNLGLRQPFETRLLSPEIESSSSSVTELLRDKKPQVLNKQGDWLEHFEVISHGNLTHKLMQALKYSSQVDELIDRWFQDRRSEVKKALSFMRSLKSPPLMALIENGHVEMGFSFKDDSKIIDGQIDLWGSFNNEVWIIDYKTGNPKYKDKAFLQLEYYARALKKSDMISKTQKIILSVIYPFSEKVFNKNFSNHVASSAHPIQEPPIRGSVIGTGS